MVVADSQVGEDGRAGHGGREKEGVMVIVKATSRLLPLLPQSLLRNPAEPATHILPMNQENPIHGLLPGGPGGPTTEKKKKINGKPQMEENEASITIPKTKSTFPS